MKVFLTGGSGFIGQAVVANLLEHGHQVLALARSDASANQLHQLGAETHRGDLTNLDSLRTGAAASDGVIHLGFGNDFQNFERNCAIDRDAIQAMAEGLGGGNKPLVIATGTMGVIKGGVATEETGDDMDLPILSERAKSWVLLQELSQEKGIRGMVMRYAPFVHGQGDPWFVKLLAGFAKKNGAVYYNREVNSRCPAVHRDDAADVTRLAVENGVAGGVYHGLAEQEVRSEELMKVIGKKVDLPVEGKSSAELQEKMGFLSFPLSLENPASSFKTQKELGWKPVKPGLLEDVEKNYDLSEA